MNIQLRFVLLITIVLSLFMSATYIFIRESFQVSIDKNQTSIIESFSKEEQREVTLLEQKLKEKSQSYSGLLAKSTAQAMYNFDMTSVQHTVNEFLKDKEVESAVIKDSSGKVVAGKIAEKFFHSASSDIKLDNSDKLGTATIFVNQSEIEKNREILKALFKEETNKISDLLTSNQTTTQKTLLLIFIIGTLSLVLIVFVLTRYSVIKPLFKPIIQAAATMRSTTEKMLNLSEKNSETSLELSKNAESFSAQMQEVSSSITEISSIVTETAAITSSNRELVSSNANSTDAGQQAVIELNGAINEINNSQTQIVKGFENTMEQMKALVTSIENIHTQIEVMRDIVFQTKLLSFNASVEAARAGEHGKGFSIVASEIGQLATHSNKAAEDIFAIIEKSKNDASKNIQDSQSIVNQLIEEVDKKIKVGSELIARVNETFETVTKNSNHLNKSAEQVSTSTNEQSRSVLEIQKSIEQANKANEESLTGIRQLSEFSLTLKNELEEIGHLSIELQDLVGVSIGKK